MRLLSSVATVSWLRSRETETYLKLPEVMEESSSSESVCVCVWGGGGGILYRPLASVRSVYGIDHCFFYL